MDVRHTRSSSRNLYTYIIIGENNERFCDAEGI